MMGKAACLTKLLLIYMFLTVVFIIWFAHWYGPSLTRWPPTAFPLPPCVERVDIEDNITTAYVDESIQSLMKLNKRIGSTLQAGGKFHPKNCTPVSRVAILIPYRDREENLHKFLNHMHPFLQGQNIMYGIYVVEIDNSSWFNRALLINVGFIESLKEDKYNCIVLHDVDFLPEDYRIPYMCPEAPTHLSVYASQYNYRLPYTGYFGGVNSFPTEVFRQINGMSNMFFGWGGEDDELTLRSQQPDVIMCNLFTTSNNVMQGVYKDVILRLKQHNWTISRLSGNVGRYRSLPHKRDANTNPHKFCLFKSTRLRSPIDGLNSVKYTLLKKEHLPLYTWILIRVNSTQILTENESLASIYNNCLTQ